jgi:hypothetical protein
VGVDLGLAHLEDVDEDLLAGHVLEALHQLVDLGALLADDDPRARGVDVDPQATAARSISTRETPAWDGSS